MSVIGFIGSGKIGSTLARLAVDAGHEVVMSNSRGPATLAGLVAELGPQARAAEGREAARAGEIVVISIPLAAYAQVPVEPLRGKVVLDTANYKPQEHPGRLPDVDSGRTTAHEVMQYHLPESFVVKAVSNVFFKHLLDLRRPVGAADRSALPIAGNDTAAKFAVGELLDSLGFDHLDVGPLIESRRFAVFGAPAQRAYLDPEGPFTAPGRPASADQLAELLALVP